MSDEINFEKFAAGLPVEIKGEAMTRFASLAPELKQMLTGHAYGEAVLEIAKSQKLSFEQLAFFQAQTVMALLGFCTADEYRARLAENFAKDDAGMDEFMNLANEKIFDVFKELLHKLF
ncbi:MAG: hypothetical protein WCO65_03050 [bacterium]